MLIAASRAFVLVVAGVGVAAVALPAWAADPPSDPAGTPTEVTDPFGETRPGSDDPFAPQPSGATADPFAAKPDRRAAAPDPFARPLKPAASPQPQLRTWSGCNPETMKHFEKALRSQTSVLFVDEPLEEVIHELSIKHKIPMLIDVRSLEEIGLSGDVPVRLELKDVSLRSCLRLMMRELDLNYVIKDEVLQITTQESAETMLSVAIYRLDTVGINAVDGQALIKQMVSPDAWVSLGGVSTITAMSNSVKGEELLVISATQDVHEGILELLQTIAAQNVTDLKTTDPKATGGH